MFLFIAHEFHPLGFADYRIPHPTKPALPAVTQECFSMNTMNPMSEAITAIRALLEGLIDYAGFAPPASLPMSAAVKNYAAYRDGPYSWALGRFVTPSAQLSGFEAAAREMAPFPLSVLLPPGALFPTSARNSIDAIEVKAESPRDIVSTMKTLPQGTAAYFEIAVTRDPADLIRAMAETGARAKVRTGGLTPDLFPTSADLARFISRCARTKVPFKATAGLHHPIRAVHKLTYASDAPSGIMHGFLNVFLASTLMYCGGTKNDAIRLLEEQSPDAFRFNDAGVHWHDHCLNTDQIARARKNFALGFGSCSFEEPIADLQTLGLLPHGSVTHR
jgi:hypothetical protein